MKPQVYTTFQAAHDAGACNESYRKMARALGGIGKYGRDKKCSMITVLDALSLDDALWALDNCAMGKDANRIKLQFQADAAARVLKYFERDRPTDTRPRDAIKAIRDYASGKIDDAARDAAWAAARDAEREWQETQLRAYLNGTAEAVRLPSRPTQST